MIRVRAFNAHPKYRVRLREFLRLTRRVMLHQRCKDIACNIIFVDDKDMENLNGKYLRRWYPTDVLSFPLDQEDDTVKEGEVYVNLDQARRQAHEYRAIMKNEVSRLVIHGLLHLLGYRDTTKREKRRMTQLEDSYLNQA